MKIKLFADGANLDDMLSLYESGVVSGFTTNPTLMRRAGIIDYEGFAREVLANIKDVPVSFEVFSDDHAEMINQAYVLDGWGENVYVKIPITDTKGEPTTDVVTALDGVKLNITAICDIDQITPLLPMLSRAPCIVSVFAGRIADTGRDASFYMWMAKDMIKKRAELLWASTRQVYSIIEAEEAGCDIITVPSDILKKLSWIGRNLKDLSLDTVKQFYEDAKASGYTV